MIDINPNPGDRIVPILYRRAMNREAKIAQLEGEITLLKHKAEHAEITYQEVRETWVEVEELEAQLKELRNATEESISKD